MTEAPEECEELRANYCATVALCDHELGRLLDDMDRHAMWDDTALIVTTDHGFLLGEHDWWAKILMPCYNEVAHIPLFLHHPALADRAGTRCDALTQTTISRRRCSTSSASRLRWRTRAIRCCRHLRATRPRATPCYTACSAARSTSPMAATRISAIPPTCAAADLFQYTLMPAHMKEMFSVAELADATLSPPLPFTKGVPLLKVPATPKSPVYFGHGPGGQQDTQTVLYDLRQDPGQTAPIHDDAVEARLVQNMARLMRANDAPAESFVRLGLAP